jgi:hypothetical protein
MGRGHVTDSQSELFNKRLRSGQAGERIPFRVED